MNLPIDVVVELLMANCQEYGEYGHESDMWVDLPCGTKISDATSKRLRTKVSDYLLTLVPKPVLLSECEEGKPYVASGMNGWLSVVARSGEYACDVMLSGRLSPTLLPASDFQVIQPVEVQ